MKLEHPIIYYFLLFSIITSIDITMILLYFKDQYTKMLEKIQSSNFKIRYIPAILFYFLFTFGILLYVIPVIKQNNLLIDSLLYGGLFGLILYGFYSLTVDTFIEKWKLSIVIMDTIWGFLLSFISVYLSLKLYYAIFQ